MKINKYLTPYNHNESTIDRIKYIVIHYVGALGGAEANCKYYAGGYIGSSAHYFVGHGGEVWQSVEDQNIAWHCGGRKYENSAGGAYHGICTNANSIGIEMCVRKTEDGVWYIEPETVAAAIELTKDLIEKYDIPIERVIRHYDVNGKTCPEPYVRDPKAWDKFKAALVPAGKWIQDDHGWRWQRADGTYLKNQWKIVNHHWYLFGADGYMLTGWQQKDGCWYYLEEDGDYQGACWHEAADGSGALERWYVG